MSVLYEFSEKIQLLLVLRKVEARAIQPSKMASSFKTSKRLQDIFGLPNVDFWSQTAAHLKMLRVCSRIIPYMRVVLPKQAQMSRY
jgi:hypothetical protein